MYVMASPNKTMEQYFSIDYAIQVLVTMVRLILMLLYGYVTLIQHAIIPRVHSH